MSRGPEPNSKNAYRAFFSFTLPVFSYLKILKNRTQSESGYRYKFSEIQTVGLSI